MLAGLLAYLSGHKEDFANETMFTVFLVICGVLLVITIVGYWKVFEKMGEPGWKAIIPIYSNWVIFQRCAEVRQVFWVYCVAVVVEVVANFGIFGSTFSLGIEDWARTIACGTELYMFFEMARCFGKSWRDGIGMWILEFVYIPRLGFDASEYRGRHSSTGHRYLMPGSAPQTGKTSASGQAAKPAAAASAPAQAPAQAQAQTKPKPQPKPRTAAPQAKRPSQAPAAKPASQEGKPAQTPAALQQRPAQESAPVADPHSDGQDAPESPAEQ